MKGRLLQGKLLCFALLCFFHFWRHSKGFESTFSLVARRRRRRQRQRRRWCWWRRQRWQPRQRRRRRPDFCDGKKSHLMRFDSSCSSFLSLLFCSFAELRSQLDWSPTRDDDDDDDDRLNFQLCRTYTCSDQSFKPGAYPINFTDS